ncbi:Tat (twin-arginine translocation) pathway signal sequence [Pseudomonas antarctica]|uniref:Dipeptide transporter ATP-binding subunit n=1 Tax=Pseudomonas antarctica TaxID=219572 RepID=A0A1H0C0K5_9PSED|nr:dipeptide transporter ATP-binding subunit [Pseudomonas antarctica]SDN51454.1 Tat (twin-arginine translocation) pathway signal sequence [Pseudomonas antarctica]
MSENNNKMAQAMHRRDFLEHCAVAGAVASAFSMGLPMQAFAEDAAPKPGGVLRLGLAVGSTHNVASVRAIADQVLVMQRGRAVDQGRRSTMFTSPYQDCTGLLFLSEPETDRTDSIICRPNGRRTPFEAFT